MLLHNGAYADACTENTFHETARHGHSSTMQLLLEAKADVPTQCLNAALRAAVLRGHTSTVQLLLEYGAHDVDGILKR